MTRNWSCICTSLSPFPCSLWCYICFYSSYRIVIELHFHSVRKLSVLYRLEAGFQRFPCKKSASFDNHSTKDCYCIDLCTFTYFYSHYKSVYSIQLYSFLLISS